MEAEANRPDVPSPLCWRVHLAREQPAKGLLAVTVVVVGGVLGAWVFRHPLPGVTAAALLTSAAGEFLFPVSYRLTPEGAESRSPFAWRRMAWAEVKQVYVGNGWVKLSPLRFAGPREAYRGVTLRCGGGVTVMDVRTVVRGFRAALAPAESTEQTDRNGLASAGAPGNRPGA